MKNIFEKIIKVSLYLLVFFIPLFFLPFTFEVFEFNKIYLLFFLVSIGFIFSLIKTILEREIKFKKIFLNNLVLAFLFIAILSALFSVDKTFSFFGFYGRFSDGLLPLLCFVIFYFLLINNIKTEKEISNLTFTFLLSSFLVILITLFSIFGIWQKFLNIPLGIGFNTVGGSLEGLTIFLVIVITLLTGTLLIQSSKFKNIFYIFLLLLGFSLLIIINFKPAWILLIITLALSFIFGIASKIFRENINKLLLPVFLIILSLVFLFFNFFDFQLSREQILPTKISWQIAFKAATENLKSGFLGSGLGTYFYEFSKFKPVEWNKTPFWLIRFDRAGNHMAEIFGTVGFLGFFSYLALISIFLFISSLLFPEKPKSFPFLIAFLALFLAQFFYYQNTVLAFSFWLFLGLSVVSWESPTKSKWGAERTISLKKFPEIGLLFSTLLIIICVITFICYYFGWRYYRAENFYLEAQRATENSQIISFLEKAINLNPNFAQYRIDLARAYLSEVLNEMRKPVEVQDQNAIILAVQQAINYAKGARLDGTSIKGATEISPNWVVNWENLGVIYREITPLVGSSALDWGIRALEKALKLENTNPILHTELGKLYLAQGNIEKAKTEFKKAIELKEDYLDARLQEVLILEREENLDEAIKKMEEIVINYPLNIETRFQLGRLYFNQDRLDEAIFQFETAISIMPNHSNSLYSLGLILEEKGEKEIALEYFEKVLELNPGNQEILRKIEELKR